MPLSPTWVSGLCQPYDPAPIRGRRTDWQCGSDSSKLKDTVISCISVV